MTIATAQDIRDFAETHPLPDKPNWLEVGLKVRLIVDANWAGRKVDLPPGLAPEVGDVYKISAIYEHPNIPNWFGVGLEGIVNIYGRPQAIALYDGRQLPNIIPVFEPVFE